MIGDQGRGGDGDQLLAVPQARSLVLHPGHGRDHSDRLVRRRDARRIDLPHDPRILRVTGRHRRQSMIMRTVVWMIHMTVLSFVLIGGMWITLWIIGG